jgi:hypothetical protein
MVKRENEHKNIIISYEQNKTHMINDHNKIQGNMNQQYYHLSEDFNIFRKTAESNDHRLNNENMLLKTEKNNLNKDASNQKSDMTNIISTQKAEIEYLTNTNSNLLRDKQGIENELNQQKMHLLNELETLRLTHQR